MKLKRPIIALDFNDAQRTLDFLQNFPQTEKLFVKIGMELYYSAGQDLVKAILEQGHDVFLDLKCHDIPHTVERAMDVLGQLGVSLTTTHANGGHEMLKAAKYGLVEGALKAGKKEPQLLAITQLTSTDERMVKEEQLITVGLEKSVENYAKLAQNAGLDGVVCSGWEANKLREVTGPEFLRVTPGIRLKTDSLGDQKRVMTPDMAAQNGSSAIVVGRPITQAKDPVTAYQAIFELWNQ